VSGDIVEVVRELEVVIFWWLKFAIFAIKKEAPSNMIK
jgi:hypothetical protein